jgi:hypothetical protein
MKKTRNSPASPAGGCKRYAQAITDYVLGEEIDVPKEELMAHLKECAPCRQEATNWQDFQNALRVKEYHARPEVKEKWDKFIRELTAQPVPAVDFVPQGKPLNVAEVVGSPAGKVWQALASNGVIKMEDLPKKTGLTPELAWGAMGWLAHENKLCITKHKDHYDLYLSR